MAELIENEARFRALRKAFQQLDRIDADKITGDILNLTSVTASEKIKMRKMSDPAKESEKKIQLVLQLRTFIKQLPNIKNILAEDGKPKSVMLATITKILGDDRLKAIEEEIAEAGQHPLQLLRIRRMRPELSRWICLCRCANPSRL